MIGEQKMVLTAFSRALAREAHVLARQPELLWQQLYNRLQWEGAETQKVLVPEMAMRSSPGAAPWARTRTRFRESEALLRTLTGQASELIGCAVSPDGTWIVSAGMNETLKVWDAATGRELRTLTGHTKNMSGFAVSPDGAWIVSAGG